MNRYRITVLVVCLVLIVLAAGDFYTLHRNSEPQIIAWDATAGEISIDREWVTITGGTLMLEEAVSNSGELEIDALVIPLVRDIGEKTFRILIETRDPRLVEAFATYHLGLDSEAQKTDFLQKNISAFQMQRAVSGMVVVGAFGGLMPNRDREIMYELAEATNMDLADNAVFVHEGKEPASPIRGVFFLLVGLAGIIKLIIVWRKNEASIEAAEIMGK